MEGTGGLEWRRDATSNVNHLDQGWNATSIGSTVKRSRIMHGHFATKDNLGGEVGEVSGEVWRRIRSNSTPY